MPEFAVCMHNFLSKTVILATLVEQRGVINSLLPWTESLVQYNRLRYLKVFLYAHCQTKSTPLEVINLTKNQI